MPHDVSRCRAENDIAGPMGIEHVSQGAVMIASDQNVIAADG